MDDEMNLYIDNFYKTRQNLFWMAPDHSEIYYGRYSYRNLDKIFDKNGHTPHDLVYNSVIHRLLTCSTRTVLYNLMCISHTRLLNMMNIVLSFIDINNKNPKHALHNLVSIYNCLYLVVVECGHGKINKAKKISESNRIATYIDKHMLCPWVPTNKINSLPNADYTFVLPEMPHDFYRDEANT